MNRQFLAGLLQLGSGIVVARLLGLEAMGIYTLSLLFPLLLGNLLNLGIPSANVYYIASGKFKVESVWDVSRNLAMYLGGVGFSIAIIIIQYFGHILFPSVKTEYLFVTSAIIPLILLNGTITSIFQGLQDFRSFNIVALLQPALGFSGLLLLWQLHLSSLFLVLSVTLVSYFVSAIVSALLLRKYVRIFSRSLTVDTYLRVALRYGWKSYLGNLLSFLDYRGDVILLNYFVGPAAAGTYTVAVRFAELLWVLSSATATVVFPKLSSMQSEEKSRIQLTVDFSQTIFWVTFFASIVLAIVAPSLIPMLYGIEFDGAVLVLFILLPGVVALSSARILANDLAARNLVHINLWLSAGFVLLNVTLNLIMIRLYGTIGAAFTSAISYSLSLVLRLLVQQQITGVRWWKYILPNHQEIKKAFTFLLGLIRHR